MTILHTSNALPSNGADAFYRLFLLLVSAGWTVRASGDGLSAYSSSGTVFSNGANSGANGFNNSRAWIRLRMPGTDAAPREFTFQRGTNATDFRIKYSAGAAFTGGSPSATVTPTAANEAVLSGSGSDASPAYVNWVGTINRVSYWADNAAPYGWGMVGWSTGGALTFGMALEAMETGTYPVEDLDPYVLIAHPNSNTLGNSASAWCLHSTTFVYGWFKYGLSGAAWVNFWSPLMVNVSSVVYVPNASGGGAANPYSGKDDEIPIAWMRQPNGTQPGWKGFGKYFRWTWAPRPGLTTLSRSAGAKDRLVVNQASQPWGGVDPLL